MADKQNTGERISRNEEKIAALQKESSKTDGFIEQIQTMNNNVFKLSGEIKGLVMAIETQNQRIIDFKKAMDRLENKIDAKIDNNQKDIVKSLTVLNDKVDAIEERERDLEQNPFREKVTAWEDTKRKVLVGVATAAAVSVLGAAVTVIVHFIRTGIIG